MRRLRQSKLLPPKVMADASVAVVGLGTLGSWAALALAKMGVPRIELWDGDKVETVNMPLQVYSPDDHGETKAVAMEGMVLPYYTDNPTSSPYLSANGMWDGHPLDHRFIISGVDSFEARRQLFAEGPTDTTTHFIDLRSGRETLLTYCVTMASDAERMAYIESLTVDPIDLDCKEQGIVYVGMRAGAEAAAMVAGLLRGFKPPFSQLINTNFFDSDPRWSVH